MASLKKIANRLMCEPRNMRAPEDSMKATLFLTLGTALLLSRASAVAEHAVPRDVRRAGAEPQWFQINDGDKAMRGAVHQARRTVNTFIAALQHPEPGQSNFEVKKPFVQNGEAEHLWLTDVRFSGNRFHGRVDNRPLKIKGLRFGDRVSVNPDEISDWAFIDHGRLIGGYTIKALYAQLTPDRRKELKDEVIFQLGKR